MESMSQERAANLTVGSEEEEETKIEDLTKRKTEQREDLYKRETERTRQKCQGQRSWFWYF